MLGEVSNGSITGVVRHDADGAAGCPGCGDEIGYSFGWRGPEDRLEFQPGQHSGSGYRRDD
jgi:hypothetical protein